MADVNANIGVNIDTSQALSQLKALQRQISQFHTSISRSSEAAALAQRDLQRNFINSVNSIGAFSAELRAIKTTAESFTDALQKNKFGMREYFRYSAGATKSFSRFFKGEFDTINKVAEENVKRLQTQYIKMGRDANGVMRAIAIMPKELDMGNYNTQVQLAAQRQAIFNQLVKQGTTNLLNFGKNTQWAGRQLMVGFTLPLASLGAVASRTFMEMETAALKFRKVYGDLFTPSQEREQALADITALGEMFTKYGISVSQTVNLAADAAAAGFQGLDLQRQVTEATRLQVLGQIDQQKALETTISLQNAFRLSNTDLSDSINFLNAVENQTVVSLDDITTAIPKVAPVIMQLGGNVKDLAFFMTAMKQGGVNASEGANALKSGLGSLINPTEKASEMLAGMGININKIVESNRGNLRATVVDFARALDTLDPLTRARAIEQLFGKFQFARLSTLFENVTKEGTQAARVLELAGYSASDLAATAESELGMTAESGMMKFRKAVEDLRLTLVPVGQTFLEAVTPIVEFLGNILDKFNNLSSGTKKAITILTVAIGAIGPVALMTFGLLANALANIMKGANILRNGYLRLTGQSQVLTQQTDYLTVEQQNAAAVAHSLEQTHARLIQTFNVESGAVDKLAAAYRSAISAGINFAKINPGMMGPGGRPRGYAKGGIVVVPGSGNGDTVPAMLTPGEAVIPKDMAKRYAPLIQGMIAGNIPGYQQGTEGASGFVSEVSSRITGKSKGLTAEQFLSRELEKIPAQLAQPFETLVREITSETNITLNDLKQNLRTFRAQYVKNIGQQERPQFTHIGAGSQMTAQEILQTGAISRQTVSQRLQRFSQVLPEEKLGVKTGYAVEMQGKINNALQGAGANLEEFITDFRERGINKWRKTIEIGGGSFENMIGEVTDYDNRMAQAIQQRIDGGAKLIFDTRADIEEASAAAKAKGEEFDSTVAIALDEVDLELRTNIEFLGSELSAVFDTALRTITDIRINLDPVQKQLLQKTDPALYRELGFERTGGQPRFAGGSTTYQKPGGMGVLPAVTTQATDVVDSAVLAMTEEAQTQSPSRRTIPIGEDLARGLQVGMMNQSDETRLTAGSLVDDAVTGLINPKTGRAFTQAERASFASRTPLGSTTVGAIQEATPVSQKTLQTGEKLLTQQKNMSVRMNDLNGKLMGATFAISALSSTTALFGSGSLANLSGVVAKITTAMFALMTVTQALTQAKILDLAATRAGTVAKAIDPTATGLRSLLSTVTGFLPKLRLFGTFIARFAGLANPVGATIAAVSLLAIGLKVLNNRYEESRRKVEAFSNSLKPIEGEKDFLSEYFNFVPVTGAIEEFGKELQKVSVASRSEREKLKESEQFQKTYQEFIKDISLLGDKQAKTALKLKGLELISAGMPKEKVQELMGAIQEEAGKSNLKIDFASISFDSAGIDKLNKEIGNSLKGFQKIYESDIKTGLAYAVNEAGQSTGDLVETLYEGPKAKQAINDAGAAVSSYIKSISALTTSGQIDAKQYNRMINGMFKSISKSMPNAAMQVKVFDKAMELIDPQLAATTKDIDDLATKQLLLSAATAGVSSAFITSAAIAYRTANAYNKVAEANVAAGKAADSSAEAAYNRAKANDEWRKIQAQLKIEIKDAVELSQLLNQELNSGTGETKKNPFREQLDTLNQQIVAYNNLRKAKVDSAIASEIAGNSEMAALLQTGAQVQKNLKYIKDYAEQKLYLTRLEQAGAADQDYENARLQTALKYINLQEQIIDMQNAPTLKKYNAQIELQETILGKIEERIKFISQSEIIPRETLIKQNNYQLERIGILEEKVNEKYDRQEKALNAVIQANKDILALQKSRISIADALTRGDIAAAAQAVQDFKSQQQSIADDTQSRVLQQAREAEIAALGRVELEKQNKELQLQISFIQQDQLDAMELAKEQVQDKIDLINNEINSMERLIQKQKDSIRYFGMSKEQIENASTLLSAISELDITPKLAGFDDMTTMVNAFVNAAKGDINSLDLLLNTTLPTSARNSLDMLQQLRNDMNLSATITISTNKDGVVADLATVKQQWDAFSAQAALSATTLITNAKFQIDQITYDQFKNTVMEVESMTDKMTNDILNIFSDNIITDAEVKAFADKFGMTTEQAKGMLNGLMAKWNGDKDSVRAASQSYFDSLNKALQGKLDTKSLEDFAKAWGLPTTTATKYFTDVAAGVTGINDLDYAVPGADAATGWQGASAALKAYLDALAKAPTPTVPAVPTGPTGGTGQNGDTEFNPLIPMIPYAPPPPPAITKCDPGFLLVNGECKPVNAGVDLKPAGTAASQSTVTGTKIIDGRTVVTSTSNTDAAANAGLVLGAGASTSGQSSGGGRAAAPGKYASLAVARGGLISAQYLARGGIAKMGRIKRGTDTVPAMLTPGEFVMSKYAVQNYGVDRLRAINNGESSGHGVYNYSINLNVKSDSNPDDIAKAVMTQIKRIDSQRIRGQIA